MIEKGIWRLAQAIIRQHGDYAAIEAATLGVDCLERGDLDGETVWKRVIRAIEELRNTMPASLH